MPYRDIRGSTTHTATHCHCDLSRSFAKSNVCVRECEFKVIFLKYFFELLDICAFIQLESEIKRYNNIEVKSEMMVMVMMKVKVKNTSAMPSTAMIGINMKKTQESRLISLLNCCGKA